MRRKSFGLAALILLPALLSPAQSDPALERLDREIARLAAFAGGTVGVGISHIESGRRVSLRGSERFPMASTFKVPVAVQLLTRVDRGEVRLDQLVAVETADLSPGSGTLSDLFNKPGVALSVRNLLELMLLISDNTATDICMRLAGGAGAVTERMRAIGIRDIDVDRTTTQLIADWVGVAALPPREEWSPELFRKLFGAVSAGDRKTAAARFDEDPRDTASPDAMRTLLERIQARELLEPETAELLIDIMRRCRTGEARLKGRLPAGTEVAHKTGTVGGTTNDVGILTLPGDAGHVAIAVFVKSSDKEVAQRERAIAEIARAAHDYFLFR